MKQVLLPLLFCSLVASVSEARVPKCSDKNVKSEVLQKIEQALHNSFHQFGIPKNTLMFSLKNVSVDGYNEQLGRYLCQANISASISPEDKDKLKQEFESLKESSLYTWIEQVNKDNKLNYDREIEHYNIHYGEDALNKEFTKLDKELIRSKAYSEEEISRAKGRLENLKKEEAKVIASLSGESRKNTIARYARYKKEYEDVISQHTAGLRDREISTKEKKDTLRQEFSMKMDSAKSELAQKYTLSAEQIEQRKKQIDSEIKGRIAFLDNLDAYEEKASVKYLIKSVDDGNSYIIQILGL